VAAALRRRCVAAAARPVAPRPAELAAALGEQLSVTQREPGPQLFAVAAANLCSVTAQEGPRCPVSTRSLVGAAEAV
jgi:hypothetical protein